MVYVKTPQKKKNETQLSEVHNAIVGKGLNAKLSPLKGKIYPQKLTEKIRNIILRSYSRFNSGVEAYKSGNYEKALEGWRSLAEQGYALAQYNLGWVYQNGKGASQDYQEAIRYYKLAAEQGFAGAQYSLGLMYYRGEGVLKSLKDAAYWIKLADKNGGTKAKESWNEYELWKHE